jgi:hypothetical protein
MYVTKSNHGSNEPCIRPIIIHYGAASHLRVEPNDANVAFPLQPWLTWLVHINVMLQSVSRGIVSTGPVMINCLFYLSCNSPKYLIETCEQNF